MKKYDYLIVGSGLFGSVCAHELGKAGKSCLVLERRDHIGGNIYTENVDGIDVHKYGAHIFHTSDKRIWDYINGFAEFNNFVNSPIARYNDECYNLPFNMNTFTKLWPDVFTPAEARARIEEEKKACATAAPRNLEEQALTLVGRTIYEKLIKGYTEKQWGRPCDSLPAFIIRRLPVRFTFDNNYFDDRYQGIPVCGYTEIIKKMLYRADVLTKTDFLADKEGWLARADRVIYTGAIDEYYGRRFGALRYRTVNFETERLDIPDYQGNAVINYTSASVPFTRVIEHKHFNFGKQPFTIVSREYSVEWQPGVEPYYPINDDENNALYEKYRRLADLEHSVVFGGRLGTYKYFDMHVIIKNALSLTEQELSL